METGPVGPAQRINLIEWIRASERRNGSGAMVIDSGKVTYGFYSFYIINTRGSFGMGFFRDPENPKSWGSG